MKVINDSIIPDDGEWVLGAKPDCFVITVFNKTEFFPGQERLAILAKNDGVISKGTQPGKSLYTIGLVGLRTLDGRQPGANLDKYPQTVGFLSSEYVAQRVGESLNLWTETITEEEKVAVWSSGLEGASTDELLRMLKDVLKA